MLTVSPLAKGLFHQSSSHSGPCIGSWGPGPQPDGYALSAQLMKKLRAPTIDAMRRVNASDLVWPNFGEIANFSFPGIFLGLSIHSLGLCARLCTWLSAHRRCSPAETTSLHIAKTMCALQGTSFQPELQEQFLRGTSFF